jgi:hypothetical protein
LDPFISFNDPTIKARKILRLGFFTFLLLVLFSLCGCAGQTVTVVPAKITTLKTTSASPNAIATIQSMGVGYDFTNNGSPILQINLVPTTLAIANREYTVELYDKGNYRASTTVSWNQPEINVGDSAQVKFSVSQTEYSAYYSKDVSTVFSVKITANPLTMTTSTIARSKSYATTTQPKISTIIGTTTPTPVTPLVTNVSKISAAQNQIISISGQGFGNLAPYNGNSKYIEISDVTQGWDAGHSASVGETANGVTLNITQWTPSQILISGFAGKYGTFSLHVGDNLTIKVWNAPSGLGPSSYSIICGAATNASSSTPGITSVSLSSPPSQTFTIKGQGFGNLDPYNGDSPFIEVTNVTSGWNAGFSGGSGETPNGLTLSISLWTDNQIVISGFTGNFPASFQTGDNLTFKIWSVPSRIGPALFSTIYTGS